MKRKKINSEMQEEWQRIVAYLDSSPLVMDLRQARLASLRKLQSHKGMTSAGGEELGPLLSSGHFPLKGKTPL